MGKGLGFRVKGLVKMNWLMLEENVRYPTETDHHRQKTARDRDRSTGDCREGQAEPDRT